MLYVEYRELFLRSKTTMKNQLIYNSPAYLDFHCINIRKGKRKLLTRLRGIGKRKKRVYDRGDRKDKGTMKGIVKERKGKGSMTAGQER